MTAETLERITKGETAKAVTGTSKFDMAQRVGLAAAQSDLVPESYRNNLPNCLIAIDLADRIGCAYLMVMQNLAIVKGRPSWSSTFLIATVNASGRFTPLRFRFQGEEGTDQWGCRAVATDKDSNEECRGALITIQLAKDEGWYARKGSSWPRIPEQMLMYRSAAFWSRVYCPELSLGLHSSDEVADFSGAAVERSTSVGLEEAMEGVLKAEIVDDVAVLSEIVDESTGEITTEGTGEPMTPIEGDTLPEQPAPPSAPEHLAYSSIATDSEIEKLSGLMETAKSRGVLPFDIADSYDLAIIEKDGVAVRDGIRETQKRML